jgi:hypothetical protein
MEQPGNKVQDLGTAGLTEQGLGRAALQQVSGIDGTTRQQVHKEQLVQQVNWNNRNRNRWSG